MHHALVRKMFLYTVHGYQSWGSFRSGPRVLDLITGAFYPGTVRIRFFHLPDLPFQCSNFFLELSCLVCFPFDALLGEGLIDYPKHGTPAGTSFPHAAQPGRCLRANISRRGSGDTASISVKDSSGFSLCRFGSPVVKMFGR